MSDSVVLKVVTAGDGGVGKTTLIHRYVEGVFIDNTKMTIGVGFSLKELTIGGVNVTLQIWDFTGQEHLRFMLERYVYGSNGALYMFDLNNITRSLRNIDIWWNMLHKDADIPIILIGTKEDLLVGPNRNRYELYKNLVSEAREKYKFIDYIKTSSKSGENVERAFEILVNNILENQKSDQVGAKNATSTPT